MATTQPLSPLTPVRYDRPNFFTIDLTSIGIKDAHQQLEHPVFALSKKPDLAPRRYADKHGNRFEIIPSALGQPTIWDKDLLIFAISQVMAARAAGEPISPRIRFHTADVIEFCQRTKGGSAYSRIDRALTRLAGALLKTNIRSGGGPTTKGFHLIDEYTLKRQYDESDGRLLHCEFTLSDWLFRAIQANEVLTLHPAYFRLRQALARRLYEIARKHCGRQPRFQIRLALLHEKCGSLSPLAAFRRELRKIAVTGDLLDYDLALTRSSAAELAVFRLRPDSRLHPNQEAPDESRLDANTVAKARDLIAAQGRAASINQAEADYRDWIATQGIRPVNLQAHFLAFCQTWAQGQMPTKTDEPRDADLPLRARLALAWWEEMNEDRRAYWRETIDGMTGDDARLTWAHSDIVIAEEAFDRRFPLQGADPQTCTIPAVLIAHIEATFIDEGIAPQALIAAWRHFLTHNPSAFIPSVITDPLMSLWTYTQDALGGLPQHRALVDSLEAVLQPPAPDTPAEEPDPEPPKPPRLTEDALAARRPHARAWWESLTKDERDLQRALNDDLPDGVILDILLARHEIPGLDPVSGEG